MCARRARHGAHGVDRRAGALLESVANGAARRRCPRVLWVPGRQSMTLGPSRAWPNPEARHIVRNVYKETVTACRTTGARTTKSAALGRLSNSLAARRSLGIAGVGSALGVAGVGSARAEPAMQHHLTHRRHSTHGGAHDTARTCVAYGRRTHDKVGGARSTLQLARGSSLARRRRCRLCARRRQSAEPAL